MYCNDCAYFCEMISCLAFNHLELHLVGIAREVEIVCMQLILEITQTVKVIIPHKKL